MVRASGLRWTILSLPATLPLRLLLDPGMFDVPLDNRIEYGYVRDVAAAFGAAVQSDGVWGRTLLIGGGPLCQYRYGDMVRRILETSGVGMLPEAAFARTPFPTDWLDTGDSQRLLNYQQRTLDDYLTDLRRLLGFRRHLVRLFRPIVRWWLLRQSPYWRQRDQEGRMSGVAVITGGSSGIGAATAKRLAREGMKVVLVARGRERLERVAEEIRFEGGQAAVLAGDLGTEDECRRVYERSAEFFGAADVLVNSAGFGWYGYGEEMPLPTVNEMIGVNVGAVTRLTLLFLAEMKRRGGGHVVNVGSVVGSLPSQGVALYSATKSFVDTFTSSLYRELKGTGVNVSVVRPGAVRTGLYDRTARRSGGNRIPAERLAIRPEAVARRVIRLLKRPARVVYVPASLAIVPWIELSFGWIIDRLGPIALRRL
jgi:short-subunit dehydrogenase